MYKETHEDANQALRPSQPLQHLERRTGSSLKKLGLVLDHLRIFLLTSRELLLSVQYIYMI